MTDQTQSRLVRYCPPRTAVSATTDDSPDAGLFGASDGREISWEYDEGKGIVVIDGRVFNLRAGRAVMVSLRGGFRASQAAIDVDAVVPEDARGVSHSSRTGQRRRVGLDGKEVADLTSRVPAVTTFLRAGPATVGITPAGN